MDEYNTVGPSLNVPSPGWYGHPDDRPGIARWWDGRDWSRSTRACLAPLAPPVDYRDAEVAEVSPPPAFA